jgi:hypothetical protein
MPGIITSDRSQERRKLIVVLHADMVGGFAKLAGKGDATAPLSDSLMASAARTNPATGEAIKIKASKKIAFWLAKELKRPRRARPSESPSMTPDATACGAKEP